MTISEKVKLLEDTTVTGANAHGTLLAILRSEKNRASVREGDQDAISELFARVDLAYDRHRRMKQRLREINEQSNIT